MFTAAKHYPVDWAGAGPMELTQFLLEPHSMNLAAKFRTPVGDPEGAGLYKLARIAVGKAVADRNSTRLEIRKW